MKATPKLSQSLSLLELVKARPFTTLDARDMGIMNPAQRVSELCGQGHPIDKTYTFQEDKRGRMHRVAMYFWNPEKKRQKDLWE